MDAKTFGYLGANSVSHKAESAKGSLSGVCVDQMGNFVDFQFLAFLNRRLRGVIVMGGRPSSSTSPPKPLNGF